MKMVVVRATFNGISVQVIQDEVAYPAYCVSHKIVVLFFLVNTFCILNLKLSVVLCIYVL